MKDEKIRLQKLLALAGVASRRGAEELILAGKVKVNGRVAMLGDKADPKKDKITLAGERISAAGDDFVYIILHKPRGYVTTLKDELGRKCVAQLVKDIPARVYPVGRLDKDSEGLLIFTNDGEFANKIMHPAMKIPKTYRVTIRPDISDEQILQMSEGMEIDGEKTAPAEVAVLTKEPGRVVLQIVLHEGRNRQIRKMCELLGLEVARLKRIAIGPVKLGMLPAGKWREMTERELNSLLSSSQKDKLSEDKGEDSKGARKAKKVYKRRHF